MRIVFESVLKEKLNYAIASELESIHLDQSDINYNDALRAITHKVTFGFYKKICYNAWKLKNLILASDYYIIPEHQRVGGKLPCLEDAWQELTELKKEMETINDEMAKQVFWPLCNAILVVVFQSITNKRMDAYSNQLSLCVHKLNRLKLEKKVNYSKLEILEEVKSKILKTHAMWTSTKNTLDISMFKKVKQYHSQANGIICSLKESAFLYSNCLYSYIERIFGELLLLKFTDEALN